MRWQCDTNEKLWPRKSRIQTHWNYWRQWGWQIQEYYHGFGTSSWQLQQTRKSLPSFTSIHPSIHPSIHFLTLNVPGKPPQGGVREVSWADSWTTSPGLFYCGILSNVWGPHPAKETHFGRLHNQLSFFLSLPEVPDHTVGEGWKVDWLEHWDLGLQAHLPLHYDSPVQCLHYWYSTNPLVNHMFHLTLRPQDPLTPSPGELSWSNPRGAIHCFQNRMASDLEAPFVTFGQHICVDSHNLNTKQTLAPF